MPPFTFSRRIAFALPFALMFAATGCQLGPSAMRIGQVEYNQALQETADRQLLLNLVRLKYRESPVVLDIGSISAQFEISRSASVGAHIVENVGQALNSVSSQLGFADAISGNLSGTTGHMTGHTPDSLDAGAGITFAERPTITYSPLNGEDFIQRMLTPIGLTSIVTLVNSGWRIDRVMSITVQDINGVDNVGSASGPTPALAPEYKDFLHAIRIMRDLQLLRAIQLETDTVVDDISAPLPRDKISAGDLLQAAGANARFRPIGDGDNWVLSRDRQRPILRLIETEKSRPLIQELRETLHLTPERDMYELVAARMTSGDGADANGLHDRLIVDARSLIGVMFYLSQIVESPKSHMRDGLITRTFDEDGNEFNWAHAIGHILTIHTSKLPPLDAAVVVRERGYWFYIQDDDLNSKSTFMLLGQLFSLRAGSGKGSSPVLTLPVGG